MTSAVRTVLRCNRRQRGFSGSHSNKRVQIQGGGSGFRCSVPGLPGHLIFAVGNSSGKLGAKLVSVTTFHVHLYSGPRDFYPDSRESVARRKFRVGLLSLPSSRLIIVHQIASDNDWDLLHYLGLRLGTAVIRRGVFMSRDGK